MRFQNVGLSSFLAFAVLAICGCGFSPQLDAGAKPLATQEVTHAEAALAELDGRSISEVTVMVFPADLTREDWKKVFGLTREMGELRKKAAADALVSEKSLSDQLLKEREERQARSVDVLLELHGKYSVYFLSWGAAEDCRLEAREVRCSPMYEIFGENPLSGGNPSIVAPLQVAAGDPGKLPYIALPLKGNSADHGAFELDLKLYPERAGEDLYLKGEAFVVDGSRFIRDGTVKPHYQWGYAEIRFAPKAQEVVSESLPAVSFSQ